jgi:signal transduction histidine kinase
VAIREDITQRKKMVEDLVAAKEKAEEHDRLKSAFLANMSHEIRTPMNGILGFAEILKEPGLTGGEQKEFIEIIENSGKRMLDTLNDLIDISQIETGQVKTYITETNLNGQLSDIFNFFKPQAEIKGLQLTLKDMLPVSPAVIKTDRAKLDSILANLVKNAIKFTDKGAIELGCRQKGSFLEFYVRDTGIGVPPGRHEAIFNRFEQAQPEHKNAYQGAGLGLAISKSYVEMLGGEIRLESEEGHGSTFFFTLPFNQ